MYRAKTNLSIEAQGHLRLEGPPDTKTLELHGEGAILRLKVQGWRDLQALGATVGRGRRRRRTIHRLAASLQTLGLLLQIELAGREIARMGAGVRPSWLARLLGLAPATIPLGALTALWRRQGGS